MRVPRPSMQCPSTAHMACLTRNIDGLPYRSRVTTAEALYTITMLRHTSSSVARNNTLSDLSFLAILFLHCGGPHPHRPSRLAFGSPRLFAKTFRSVSV